MEIVISFRWTSRESCKNMISQRECLQNRERKWSEEKNTLLLTPPLIKNRKFRDSFENFNFSTSKNCWSRSSSVFLSPITSGAFIFGQKLCFRVESHFILALRGPFLREIVTFLGLDSKAKLQSDGWTFEDLFWFIFTREEKYYGHEKSRCKKIFTLAEEVPRFQNWQEMTFLMNLALKMKKSWFYSHGVGLRAFLTDLNDNWWQ